MRSMPAARDEELAVIFREMRRASERSLEILAERLKTTPAMLVALESGEIAALPEWDETSRVVNEYTGLLRLDGRPVLRRLEKRFTTREPSGAKPVAAAPSPAQARTIPATAATDASHAAPAAATRAAPPLPPKAVKGPPMPPGARVKTAMPPPAASRSSPQSQARIPMPVAEGPAVTPPSGRTADASRQLPREAPNQRKPVKVERSRKGKLVTWALLLAVFGVMGLGVRHAIQHPAAVWATVDSLPEPAPQVVRSVWEFVRPLKSTSRPAPAAEPQSQKADRLPDVGSSQGN